MTQAMKLFSVHPAEIIHSNGWEEEQIERMRLWNKKRGWGFDESDFSRIPMAPDWSSVRFPLLAVVLVPYLHPCGTKTSTQRTCEELARLLKALHPSLQENLSDFACTLLLPNADEPDPGFRWETIDLGANLGQSPNACADPNLSPHAGVLAAACHFPKWVDLIECEELPGVWIVGYADSYKIALFRNHDSRDAPKGQSSVFSIGGWAPMGNSAGNRAARPMAVPRFR